jgi:hypothetical protein
MMRRWEYKLISTNDVPGGGFLGIKEREALEAYLNQLGTDGWEIVSVDFIDGMQSPSFFQALARRER